MLLRSLVIIWASNQSVVNFDKELVMEGQRFYFVPGATVSTREGRLGILKEVITNSQNGDLMYLLVQSAAGNDTLSIPAGLIEQGSGPNNIFLRGTANEIYQQNFPPGAFPPDALQFLQNDQEARIPLHEERIKVGVRPVELGEFRVNKTVENIPETIHVPVVHDEIDIQRVPINQPLEQPLEPRYEGETLIIPVMEEVIVVQKRLILVEEIRITKRPITVDQEVKDFRRREVIKFEDTTS